MQSQRRFTAGRRDEAEERVIQLRLQKQFHVDESLVLLITGKARFLRQILNICQLTNFVINIPLIYLFICFFI